MRSDDHPGRGAPGGCSGFTQTTTAYPAPLRLQGLQRREVGGIEYPVATTLAARLLGLALLDRERAGPGLLIPRCRSVHTVGMRFELDITFLDESGAALTCRTSVAPCRVLLEPRAAAVLEVPSRRSR